MRNSEDNIYRDLKEQVIVRKSLMVEIVVSFDNTCTERLGQRHAIRVNSRVENAKKATATLLSPQIPHPKKQHLPCLPAAGLRARHEKPEYKIVFHKCRRMIDT